MAGQELDVLVVGGGITGAGCALDAASRGYSVGLVEQADFASGTSSRSSKLVHGGLRYLQNFDLGLVREALLERQLMVELAPHLVTPLPLVVPAFGDDRPDRLVGVGLNLYDVMSVSARRRRRNGTDEPWSPDRHRMIDGAEVLELLPALEGRDPSSGYLFYDCQTDDARLVLTVLAEAARFGAVYANRIHVTDLLERDGRSIGVQALDRETGEPLELRAANVINATGVWADRIRPDELRDEAEVPRIAPSRGTHITFARERLPLNAGAVVPAGGDRTIFALPWLGSTLVGTTDNDYASSELEHIAPDSSDIDYLLEACNGFFGRDLGRADITGAFAGVRPLISTGDPRKSVDISRKAELYESSSGMITITGGKLTTWRRMAKSTIDRVTERDGRDAPCRTAEIPLGHQIDPSSLPQPDGLPDGAREQLAARYGHVAAAVLALSEADPSLVQPLVATRPDIGAEVVHAVRADQARTVGDVLFRRTRLALLASRELLSDNGGVPRRVARLMARELGWDDARAAREVGAFLVEADAEGVVVAP